MAIVLWRDTQKTKTTQIDIVNMSKLDKMTVSKSLKKLTTMALVTRQENSNDTRSKWIQLTQSCIALTQKLIPLIEALDKHFFGQLGDQKEQDLIAMLQVLTS